VVFRRFFGGSSVAAAKLIMTVEKPQNSNETAKMNVPTTPKKHVLSEKAAEFINAISERLRGTDQSFEPNTTARPENVVVTGPPVAGVTDTPGHLIEKAERINFGWAVENEKLMMELEATLAELDAAKLQPDSTDNISDLEGKLKQINDQIEVHFKTEMQKYLEIDALVGAKERAMANEFETIIAGFKDIVITHDQENFPKIRRHTVPQKYFAHLLREVSSWFPGFVVQLTMPRSSDGDDGFVELIASQHEYMRAFMMSDDKGCLKLDVQLAPKLSLKRKLEDDGDDIVDLTDEESVVEAGNETEGGSFVRNVGTWFNVEIQKFKEGVAIYSWGKWKQISRHIQTRDAEQTRLFSRGVGLRYKPGTAVSKLQCAEILASTMKSAVDSVGPALTQALAE